MGLRRVISNFVTTISSGRCVAVGLRKDLMDDPIVQYVYIIYGDSICKWNLNTLFSDNGLRGEDKVWGK